MENNNQSPENYGGATHNPQGFEQKSTHAAGSPQSNAAIPQKKTNPVSGVLSNFIAMLTGKPKTNSTTPVQATTAPSSNDVESTPTVSAQAPKVKMPPIKLPNLPIKKIIIVSVVITFLVVALIVALRFLPYLNGGGISEPTPTASSSATPAAQVGKPSKYAQDPDILQVQDDLKKLDEKLNNAQYREDTLRLPQLDWEISFK